MRRNRRNGGIFSVPDRESILNVAPSKPRGGHTLSEHFGRNREENDPHSFANLYVSKRRKNQDLSRAKQHIKKHKQQRKLEALRKKKPHLDYRPITETVEDDELKSFF